MRTGGAARDKETMRQRRGETNHFFNQSNMKAGPSEGRRERVPGQVGLMGQMKKDRNFDSLMLGMNVAAKLGLPID
jgi:hypothetical protein